MDAAHELDIVDRPDRSAWAAPLAALGLGAGAAMALGAWAASGFGETLEDAGVAEEPLWMWLWGALLLAAFAVLAVDAHRHHPLAGSLARAAGLTIALAVLPLVVTAASLGGSWFLGVPAFFAAATFFLGTARSINAP